MRAKPLLPLRQPETRVDGTLGDVRPVEHRRRSRSPLALHVPRWRGHGPYHAAWFEAEALAFGGDAVLAVPTPLVAAMATTRGRGGVRWTASARSTCAFPHGGSTTLWAPPLTVREAPFSVYDAMRAALLAGLADPLDADPRLAARPQPLAARTAGAPRPPRSCWSPRLMEGGRGRSEMAGGSRSPRCPRRLSAGLGT